MRVLVSCALAATIFNAALVGQSNQKSPLPDELLDGEFRFAVIGDSGTGGREQYLLAEQLLKVHAKTQFNLLLFLGDNIYESGSPKGVEKKFLEPYAPLFLGGVEFRGVIGNHDAKNRSGVVLQQLIFKMGAETFYSFVKGDSLVEFFALDSTQLAIENDLATRQVQLRWFERALSKSASRWKIVFLHHPLFSSAAKHGIESSDQAGMYRLRRMLEPLYIKYGVTMSLNGHDHVYERTKPQHGVQYFTSGAGAKLRKGDLRKNSPFFEYGNDEVRSFMLFSVTSESIGFWCIDSDGSVLDSGVVGAGTQLVDGI